MLQHFDFPDMIVNDTGEVWKFENVLACNKAYYSNPLYDKTLKLIVVESQEISDNINKKQNKFYKL